MAKRKGLGRGLDALLSATSATASTAPGSEKPPEGELRDLAVDLIRRGKYQPRINMDPDALEELANSIRARGVVQPIVVRPIGDGHFELVAGERRWRACQLAGLDKIPALVRELADEATLAIGLIENIQRENLNPVEEARAIKRLIEEFDLTHQSAADAVGRSRAAVSNLLRLLDLNEDVRLLLESGELDMGHARALLGLEGEQQSLLAAEVVAKGWSARETERGVARLKNPPAQKEDKTLDPDVRRLESDLGERLGARVRIRHTNTGKGSLLIDYTTLEELDGILERIK